MDGLEHFPEMIAVKKIQNLFFFYLLGVFLSTYFLAAQPASSNLGNQNPDSSENDSKQTDRVSGSFSKLRGAQSTAIRSNRSLNSNLGELRQIFSKRLNRQGPSPAMKTQFLENNSVITQTRKTGKLSALSRRLSQFGLTAFQTNRFYSFSVQVQKKLIVQSESVLKKLLNLKDFTQSQAVSYFSQSPSIRSQILSLSNPRFLDLLDQDISPNLIASTLSSENISASQQAPSQNSIPSQASNVLSIGEKLRASGNARIYEEILELSGGTLTPNWKEVGEHANILLQDYDLSSFSSLPITLVGNQVLKNPFYMEISSLYGNLLTDSLVAGQPRFIGGRNLLVNSQTYDLAKLTNPNLQTLVFSASESLKLSGQISFDNALPNTAPRIVHMSGGELTGGNAVSISAATSDLVLAARKDILLKDAQLEGAREVAVKSLRNVTLNQVNIGANNLATIRAAQELNVNGLRFSRALPNIVMEANTLRLRDVHFPYSSAVRLNSLKGAIDGRYPNFGTAIPDAQQIGRVNFIKNVTSGGNLLNNRINFDRFGGNISIGKLPRP